jgi:hypothetical protein
MEIANLIQIIVLITLFIERFLKHTKKFKSKCCGLEMEREQFSPKSRTITDTSPEQISIEIPNLQKT